MTLHISRKKAHRGTIKLRRNAFGNEHYLSFEVLHGRRNPAYDGMVDDTFRRALVFLRLRPLPSASPMCSSLAHQVICASRLRKSSLGRDGWGGISPADVMPGVATGLAFSSWWTRRRRRCHCAGVGDS